MTAIMHPEVLRREILEKPYSEERFRRLTQEILKSCTPLSHQPEDYEGFKLLGKTTLDDKELVILSVKVESPRQLENIRKLHHRKVIKYLRDHQIDSALVAFYCENCPNWRLSLFYIEYRYNEKGELVREESPYKRFTYLLGEDEPCYTPTKQLWELIEKESISFEDLKDAFGVEKLSEEFFRKYRELYLRLREHIREKNPALAGSLAERGYTVEDLAKKILGQLVFLYFLQRKGWLGVPRDKPYGAGDRKFLRHLFERAEAERRSFYRDYLEPLFYRTLNDPADWSDYFSCRMPFLNGGLFEPLYDYVENPVRIDNGIFSNENRDGVLDLFDTYSFTVKEDEPSDREVAVDPEMLGKVFENLISENERKGLGAFYTPRGIVHYMSRWSLTYYLADRLGMDPGDMEKIFTLDEYEKLPESVKENAERIAGELRDIKVVDPACGSGAFLVGVLHEIVKARSLLEKTEDLYRLKKEVIENSLYGVDIDRGAVEIAKLRLWLSLVVDEENPHGIEPLPNLDYKVMCGNSLFEELVVGDEAIPLSVESQYKKNTLYQAEILETELSKKRKLFLDIVKATGRNNREAKELEKEIKNLEAKLKVLKDKPRQRVSSLLIGSGFQHINSFEHIKRLQHRFFNEHDPEKKKVLKEEIDSKLKEFILGKIEEERNKLWDRINLITRKYSGMKMPKSEQRKIIKFSQIRSELSKYKENLNFKGCNKKFFLWHLNFSEVFIEKGGFDIVIANPPYGVRISTFNRSRYRYYDSQKNSASFFIELANRLGHRDSVFAYIVPKSLTFSAGWRNTRDLILNRSTLRVAIDVSKAFENVKLEQIILIYKNSKRDGDYEFLTGEGWNSEVRITGRSSRSLSEELNTIPLYLDERKLRVLEKIKENTTSLDSISETSRGFPLQRRVRREGDMPVLKGKGIKKYTVQYGSDRVSLSEEELCREKVRRILKPKIVSQNIVAHVMNPHDRIVIMAAYDREGVLTLDTVMNTLITDNSFSHQYILALLNSRLAEWYFYWIVYNRAVRTMHFDRYYMGKLPVKVIPLDRQKPFIELVDEILEITERDDYQHRPDLQRTVAEYSRRIDRLVYELYSLTDEEIRVVEGGSAWRG